MVCQKCQQRQATVHITTFIERDMTKSDFCVECSNEMPELTDVLAHPYFSRSSRFRGMLIRVLGDRPRYPIKAYEFIFETLRHRRNFPPKKSGMETIRTVPGTELLEIIRQAVLKKFNNNAKAVLWSWNIFRTEDFGEIIFEMIDAGILAKGPGDSKDDYRNGFGFEEAFPEN
jgi:uncharacterized repeat protein (TIGR04138 family)